MRGGQGHSPGRAGPPLLPVFHLQTSRSGCGMPSPVPCPPGLLLGFREPVCHHHRRLPVNSVYFPRELGSHGPPAGAFRVCDEKHGCRITVCFPEENPPPRDGFEPAAGCMIFSLCKQLCCLCESRAAESAPPRRVGGGVGTEVVRAGASRNQPLPTPLHPGRG